MQLTAAIWSFLRGLIVPRPPPPAFDPPPADKPPYWCDNQIVRDGGGRWYRYDSTLNSLSVVVMHAPSTRDDGGPLPSLGDPVDAAPVRIPTAKVVRLPTARPPGAVFVVEDKPAKAADPEIVEHLANEYDDLVAGLGHRPDFTDLWTRLSHEIVHADTQIKAQAVYGLRRRGS
jgi:hypothetical protein